MLSTELIYDLTDKKCRMHNVSFEYCFPKMLEKKPSSGIELFEAMDELMAWAYFNDYYGLYTGIIPYQKCLSNAELDAALAQLDNPN